MKRKHELEIAKQVIEERKATRRTFHDRVQLYKQKYWIGILCAIIFSLLATFVVQQIPKPSKLKYKNSKEYIEFKIISLTGEPITQIFIEIQDTIYAQEDGKFFIPRYNGNKPTILHKHGEEYNFISPIQDTSFLLENILKNKKYYGTTDKQTDGSPLRKSD